MGMEVSPARADFQIHLGSCIPSRKPCGNHASLTVVCNNFTINWECSSGPVLTLLAWGVGNLWIWCHIRTGPDIQERNEITHIVCLVKFMLSAICRSMGVPFWRVPKGRLDRRCSSLSCGFRTSFEAYLNFNTDFTLLQYYPFLVTVFGACLLSIVDVVMTLQLIMPPRNIYSIS